MSDAASAVAVTDDLIPDLLCRLPAHIWAMILCGAHVSEVMAVAHACRALHVRFLSCDRCQCQHANYERRPVPESNDTQTLWSLWCAELTPDMIDVPACITRRYAAASIDRALREGADPSVRDDEAIRDASRRGHVYAVYRLMRAPAVDPSALGNAALKDACRMGHFLVVKRLWRDSRCAHSALFLGDDGFDNALDGGHLPIVQFLLRVCRVLSDDEAGDALLWVMRRGHKSLAQYFLDAYPALITRSNPETCLHIAVRLGWLEVARRLVAPGAACDDLLARPLELACEAGDEAMVKCILEAAPDEPGLPSGHDALLEACGRGHWRIVRRLVRDGRIAQSQWCACAMVRYDLAKHDGPLIRAATNGHTRVVDYLLRHSRVDPRDCRNYALQIACANGHERTVRRLLHDGRVDAGDHKAAALYAVAQSSGSVRILKALLRHPSLRPLGYMDSAWALVRACENGHLVIVRHFVEVVGADPAAFYNSSIIAAATHGHVSVVNYLLGLPRVDAMDCDHFALKRAVKYHHYVVVQALLEHPAVASTAPYSTLLEMAQSDERMVSLIDQHRVACLQRLVDHANALNHAMPCV